MIYLLDKATTTAKWNGIPLHEAKKGELKEILNGDYVLSIDYPITDSEHYRLLDNDKIIITDTPDNGRQLFRIKHRTELDDTVNLTCSHITEDAFKRIVGKFGVERVGCNLALNSMINALKTPFSDFSFDSDISEPHTFNNADNSTVYKVLFDGEHSIINTWRGELIRDNYSIRIVQSRGRDNNVVITTHQNLKKYERTNDTANIITRIHVTSRFKNEGDKEDTVIHATVDSPLINQYPYINEAEYNNNDLKTVAELEKWARAKFEHEKIDKMTDVIKIEAYELDGQKIQIGDTVTISSLLHDVSVTKKVTGYTYDVLAKEYIDFTFDEKGTGSSGGSTNSGVSGAADMILNSIFTDVEIEKKVANLLSNADRAFDSRFQKIKESIEDNIEKSKALSEEEKAKLAAEIQSKLTASKIDTDKIKADFDKWLKEPLEHLKKESDEQSNKIQTSVSEIKNNAIFKNDITINSDSITFGSGKVIDGNTLSSLFKATPESITAITALMNLRGDLLVDGTITSKQIKANSITSGLLAGNSVKAEHINVNAVEGRHIKFDNALFDKMLANDALINKLTAKTAFINHLKAVKIESNQIQTDTLKTYTGFIGGFRIGKHPNGWGNFLTGTNDYSVGMSDGYGKKEGQAALWVNWKGTWKTIPNNVWYVAQNGKMFAHGGSSFKGDISIGSNMYIEPSGGELYYKGNKLNDLLNQKMNMTNVQYVERKQDANGPYIVFYSNAGNTFARSSPWSDKRLKSNIIETKVDALASINKLNVYEYDFKKDSTEYHKSIGLIAQEVGKYLPDAHETFDGIETYNPFFFVPYLVKAIQQLSAKVEKLERKLNNE